jgi:hypothetical protein
MAATKEDLVFRFSRAGLVVTLAAVASLGYSTLPKTDSPCSVCEKAPNGDCAGLHAGIRAEVVRQDPSYSRPAFVMVSFILLDDGSAAINSTEGGWQIVIDGKELPDSAYILGNGPEPKGGYGILKPGEWQEFGKELEIAKYFHTLGEHTLSWKGGRFQSSTLKITIPAQ